MKITSQKPISNLAVIISILIGLLGLSNQALSQTIEVESMVQKTVMGIQSGYEVAFRTKKGFGAGTFYQSTHHLSFEATTSNYPFYGLDLSAPITSCAGAQVLAHIKAGVVNQRYFTINPEIETRIPLTKFAQVGVSAGLRSRQAVVSAKIILKTFNN